MKETLLCRPCAETLKGENKIKIGPSLRDKNTCEHCGKRRFVYVCTQQAQLKTEQTPTNVPPNEE